MRKIIDRYILKEIALPFFMILFILTFVLLMGKILQLMDLMVNKGVRFLDIAQLILFLMPSFLLFTIPISLLVGIMMALGRLSQDNEVTILKASGVSLFQLARPILLASVVAFGVTALTSYILVPQGNFATKMLLYNVAHQKASLGIKEKVFNDDFKGILLYADKVPVSGDFMEGILISDQRLGTEPNTIIARKAYLVSDMQTLSVTLRLENGSTHTVDKGLKNYRKMDFSLYDVKLDIGSSMTDEKARRKVSTEMSVSELKQQMKSGKLKDADLRELAIELHKKMSIPTSCFVFAILAIPLGIRKHRAAKSRGFTLGLITVLAYYLLRLSGEALVETGRMDVIIGTWLPNILFGAVGAYLFVMAVKEKPLWQPFLGRKDA
jgi:lipopolysaccharide export system permease protein